MGRVPGLAGRAGDSYRLAFDLLDKAGVAVAPGIEFGSHGEGHLRFSYANSIENIEEGMRCLTAYVEGRLGQRLGRPLKRYAADALR